MILRGSLFVCLFVLIGNALGENTYAVYIPEVIRPGFDISPAISILQSTNPVEVTVKLSTPDNLISFQNQAVINSGSSATINLGQIPRGYDGATQFNMNITGVDTVSGETLFFNSTSAFTYASKTLSILIQTDKAIYQPGQTIKFRAVVLKPDLRPLLGNVSYSVEDPNGNTILLETDVVLEHGVAGSEFPLNKEAVKGNWKITFETLGYKEEMTVEVKLYKLPKFKVELEVPSFIYPGSAGITIKLKGTYTYGKPVKGKASIELTLANTWGGPAFYYRPSIFGSSIPKQGTDSKPFPKFDGVGEYTITIDQIQKILGWDGTSEKKISVTGSVTDGQSDITINETVEIDVKLTNIKVEALYKPNTIKPGLFYTAYIKVTEQDGQPLMESDRLNNMLSIETAYTAHNPYSHNVSTTNHTIPPDGVVIFTLQAADTDFSKAAFTAFIHGTTSYQREHWSVDRAESPSNSYLQITTSDSSTVSPGDVATVSIRTTTPVPSIRIMTLSRGAVLRDETISGPPVSSRDYAFDVTHNMIPGVQLLGSYVRDDGEIVADYIKLTVSTALQNQVTVTSSADRVDAGTDVSIKVQTSGSGSYVGARAIDQSVLLLKSGNDISQERVVTDLNGYSNTNSLPDYWRWWWWYPIPSGAKDTSEVFSEAGMIVLTDALVYKKAPDYYNGPFFMTRLRNDGGPELMAFAPTSGAGGVDRVSSVPTPRSYFPETWLWSDAVTGADGSATFNTTAPDTITSWILSVFSVSDEYGLGLADKFKITVFRQFFVSLNLPLKITRNEIIVVQAIVFNYFDNDLTVELSLGQSTQYELLLPGDDPIAAGPIRNIFVPANGATSVKFPLRMLDLGDVPITVQAISEIAGDALTRKVFVRPEGVQECYAASILVNRLNSRIPDASQDLEIRVPTDIVPGSARVKLSVYGDILGNTLSNLGRLLRKPSGCGEQNMLSFAPDVFVTLYLHRANQLDAATKQKAFDHFHTGYSNELNYRHDDGSYSAFGKSDNSGSTWLTAFVIKCFLHARELQPTLVEVNILNTGLDFLVAQQSKDGHFQEPGKVSHKAMQGGVNSPVTMTAYVLVTLKETNFAFRRESVQIAADKARRYLEDNLNSIKTNKYALAIVTYALHVAGSTRANEALQALELLATIQGGMKYWEETDEQKSTYKESWRPPYYTPPGNDVEMTAYALLTYVRSNSIGSAAPIMKWLSEQQNEWGGYSSTQDTVIAIQAMSNVAGLLVDRPQDLTITATHTQEPAFSTNFHITPANQMVFNQVDVPSTNGFLQVTATGTGVGVAQLSVCYNVPDGPFVGEAFDCNATTSSASAKGAMVDFCCQLKPGATESTGMFLFEQKLPNGFTIDLEKERTRNKDAKLVELEDDSVNTYFDELGPGDRYCANVELQRYADVAESKPQPIAASDYYNKDRRVSKLLDIPEFRQTGACEICGSDCVGCPGPRLSEWSEWSRCVTFCTSEISTRVKHCEDPNTNDVLDLYDCGLTVAPKETKPCIKEGFPCPDFTDGLWYHMPPRTGYARQRTCTLNQSWKSSRSVKIPGTSINPKTLTDKRKQYFTCSDPVLKRRLNATTGFTVSLLVRITSYAVHRPMVFVNYGERSKTVFKFEKLWWMNAYRFSVNYGNRVYRVRGITSAHIPLNQWNHIVLTWKAGESIILNQSGAKVYVNGQRVGVSSAFITYPVPPPANPMLTIGASSDTIEWKKGYVNGGFSSVGFWSQELTQQEAISLYSFYRDLIGPNNSHPSITARQLQHFSPMDLKQCFKATWTLDSLYLAPDPCTASPPPPIIPVEVLGPVIPPPLPVE
uniref:Alpha-2-macroglobulin homolog n=1 Tax=Phallusia mammillata TaxID=59560 RepID=A0A6F9D8Y5_9ASCI|nr:alpha-2-macroglobulin homolog precursor [Phallusia mammillata]